MSDTNRYYSTSLDLYCCAHDDRPRYCDDWKVKKVGVVVVSFTDADIDNAPEKYNRKEESWYRRVLFTVEIDFAASQGTLEFRTSINGRPSGQATIEFQDT